MISITSTNQSPRRGPAPPPIKVPKLRAALIAVAAQGDPSPESKSHQPVSRHRATGSESNVMADRRHAGLNWPVLTRHESLNTVPRLNQLQPNPSGFGEIPSTPDAFEDLVGSPSSSTARISLLIPHTKPPQRVPTQSLIESPTYLTVTAHTQHTQAPPPLISRHSRSLITLNLTQKQLSLSPSLSPSTGSPASVCTPTSASNATIVTVSHRLSRAGVIVSGSIPIPVPKRISLMPPAHSYPTLSHPPPPIPINSGCSGTMDEEVNRHQDHSSFSHDPLNMLPETPRLRRFAGNVDHESSGGHHRQGSAMSFDLRNLPFTLDMPFLNRPEPITTTAEGDVTVIQPAIAIPQLPQISHVNRHDLHQASQASSSHSSTNSDGWAHPVFTPSASIDSSSSPEPHPPSPPPPRPRPRSRSVGFMTLNSPQIRLLKARPLSEHGPDHLNLLNQSDLDPIHPFHSPSASCLRLPERPYSLVSHFHHPQQTRAFPWITQPIEDHLGSLDEMEKQATIELALETYPAESHRFVVGDVMKMVEEGKACEQRAQELHGSLSPFFFFFFFFYSSGYVFNRLTNYV